MQGKICFISGGLGAGGQERALSVVASALAARGYSIFIICLFKTDVFFDVDEKINVYWPTFDRNKFHRLHYAIKLIPFIRQTIKKEKPTIVISFGDWFNSYMLISTFLMNVKTIITNRMGPDLNLGRLHEFLNNLFYKFSDLMIVQTWRAKSIIEKKYGLENVEIIPNAVKHVKASNKKKENRIVTVGRLSSEKGQDILVRAFSEIEVRSEWTLHLVGDGPEREQLNKLAKELGVAEKVHFHGFKKEIADVLSSAKIFALPSLYEGFPNALVEAMSIPLCCVASNCVAGPAEIIKNGKNGFLFKPGDHKELKEILNKLIANPKLRQDVSVAAKATSELYSTKAIIDEYERVLTRLI